MAVGEPQLTHTQSLQKGGKQNAFLSVAVFAEHHVLDQAVLRVEDGNDHARQGATALVA